MAGHKPVCVKCGLFFKPKKNGAVWKEGKPVGELRNGKPVDGTWSSYKLWYGDWWECRQCGSQIIVGIGANPIAHCHESVYRELKKDMKPVVFVEDC